MGNTRVISSLRQYPYDMTPADNAGGNQDLGSTRKGAQNSSSGKPAKKHNSPNRKNNNGNQGGKNNPRVKYAKRIDEVSAGGLPKGHIEEGESPEEAAIREVAEETGIKSEITRSLGVIDFWFMASGKRIHKTVHHFLFTEVGGKLAPQVTEVDDVAWFPIEEIVSKLAYPDERKLIAKSGQLVP